MDGMNTLDAVGGKAANLIRLQDADFNVPPFVVLGTDEYHAFVDANGLDAVIASALGEPADRASATIRDAFARSPLPDEQRHRIVAAATGLLDRPVAVRSSATAEDLPDASSAGQQDTILGVQGADDVLDAVITCWSSLWTERAITYRGFLNQGATPGADAPSAPDPTTAGLGLAVIIQELIQGPDQASGVLFTADPLTGHRGHTVIDAVFGLGEALVSGQITPDHFELDTASGAVLVRTIQGERPTLSDAQLAQVLALGRRVADEYGSPQDIEWTRVGDTLFLLQARAITSLYPLPDDARPDELWFSFGAFQGMLEPITPLGIDTLRLMMTGAASVFGAHLDFRTQPYLVPAGQRLWMRADRLLRNGIGHRALPAVANGLDPNAAALIRRFADDPTYAPVAGSARRVLPRVGRTLAPLMGGIARSLTRPSSARLALDATVDVFLDRLATRLAEASELPLPRERLVARLDTLAEVAPEAFRVLLPAFFPIMGPAVAMTQRLRVLARQADLPDADALALAVLRSLPGNVTAEMDLELWHTAQAIAADPDSRAAFATDPDSRAAVAADPSVLAARFEVGTLPAVAQAAVTEFLSDYGMRGVAEIDLGTPRWREQPEGLIRTLASYLDLDPERAPDALYQQGRRDGEAAIERLAAASGPVQARQIRFLGSRIRALFGARETPKFTLVRALGMLREGLLASGRDLVDAGVLDAPEDIFFLHFDELYGAFAGRDLRPLVAPRRADRERERRRGRVPVLLVGDGRAFFDAGTDPGDADLIGLGVSPGVVEGRARVVDDPRTSELRPGEIMVCRGTDPAWTPLFLTASGLVTEVGGLMTHGSVVAREYGLPAVVGVAGATQTLRDGRRIRLDGSSGTITFVGVDESGELEASEAH